MFGADCGASNAIAANMNNAMQHRGAHMHHHQHQRMNSDMMATMGMEEEEGDWANDFRQHHHHHHHQHHHQHHHMQQQADFERLWGPRNTQMVGPGGPAHHPWMEDFNGFSGGPTPMESEMDWASQFEQREGEDWAQEYNTEDVKTFGVEGEPLIPLEEKNRNCQFYKYLREMKGGPAGAMMDGENWSQEFQGGGPTGNWAQEFEATTNQFTEEYDAFGLANLYGEEMDHVWDNVTGEGKDDMEAAWAGAGEDADMMADEYFNRFQGGEEETADEWLEQFTKMQNDLNAAKDQTDYPFEENNPYVFHDGPLEEGMELLKNGTLQEAVLAFEAACQKDMKLGKAWELLGKAQAENEKDVLAICALRKCVDLEPMNLTALAALAVSHTNESSHSSALQALKQWIVHHPQYKDIAAFMQQSEKPVDGSTMEQDYDFAHSFLFVNPADYKEVEDMYQAAAEMNVEDVELYTGLGVLHNLSHDYEKAAVDFREAVKRQPHDYRLWNKLGATLANGRKSDEAIAAYNKALDINPGFVRGVYNLGIAYSNQSNHKAAVRQFLRAICMQQGGPKLSSSISPQSTAARNTREMWDVMRMSLTMMDRTDLVDKSYAQDASLFMDEFDLKDFTFDFDI